MVNGSGSPRVGQTPVSESATVEVAFTYKQAVTTYFKDTGMKFSSISYRTALPSALLLGGLISASLFFFGILSAGSAAWGFLLISLTSFLIIYGISLRLHNRRVEMLMEIVRNISTKSFKTYRLPDKKSSKDELDLLIFRTIRANDTVKKELARLNKIENYRKEFIGDISHELKTPIFAVQGFVETLLDGALYDEEVNRSFLQKAMRNVNRLIYLTNDLMEISRLETGELESNIEELCLKDVVMDVAESLQYKAQEEDVEILVKDFDKDIRIRADRNQIRQVLVNLIENGMKYNLPGGYVEIGIQDVEGDPSRLVLYVKDSGIGIDKKDLERVTERFFRVDKSRSRDKGGTGLGLAIVKHIVEAHGESMTIESEPDEGTVFRITFTRAGYFLD